MEKKRRVIEIRNVRKKFSRYPLFSAFSDAPMGHDSNSIRNSLVDMLHKLLGRLCTNMRGFVFAITHQIGKYSFRKGFAKLLETLDQKFSNSLKSTNVPHFNGLISQTV